jgi:two-component system, chemotaxis family, protein-glutamate methylesterase/glutaminase
MAGKTSNRLVERPTILVCPECNSSVYEFTDGNGARFRCRSGHEFSAEQICPGVEEHLSRAWANVVRTLAFHT